jgi:hypothetical protein
LRFIKSLLQNIRINLEQNMKSCLKQVEPWNSCNRMVAIRTRLVLQGNVVAWNWLAARTQFSVKLTGTEDVS